MIIDSARTKAYAAVNVALVERNWLLGKRIAEEELQGEERAAYGASVIKKLSKELTEEYGKGFEETSLYWFVRFCKGFPEIFDTVCKKSVLRLSWSHFRTLLQVEDSSARTWYMHGNDQLFASKYKLYLPTKEELRAEIETQKQLFYLQHQEKES
jgi:hypothetical protein